MTDSVVTPTVFEEKDDPGLSMHILPDDWGEEDILNYAEAFSKKINGRLGAVIVTDDDLAEAGIAKPTPVDDKKDKLYGKLHVEVPTLNETQRIKLSALVENRLPGSCPLRFEKQKKAG